MFLLLVTLLVRLLQITNITCSFVLLHLLLLISLAKCFLGVAELTTQLLRLIGILWLPLCRINKLGYTYPRRLLRSPTLVGYQDYFLALLPGNHSFAYKLTEEETSIDRKVLSRQLCHYFLAPLPGSIALSISSLGKYTLAFSLLYHS